MVNVPEFVVNNLRYPEAFAFKSGRGDDEYLLSPSKFAQLDNMPVYMRVRTQKFEKEHGSRAEVKQIDLSDNSQRKHLLAKANSWPLKGLNNINKLEKEVFPSTLSPLGVTLGVKAVGLNLDGQLEAFCLYFSSQDKRFATVPHARINYNQPRIFEFTIHAFCRYLQDNGVEHINIHADNGSMKMRALKIALRPDNFFRKYSIEPA